MNLGKLIKDSALAGVTKGIRQTELLYNRKRQINRLNSTLDDDWTSGVIADKRGKTNDPNNQYSEINFENKFSDLFNNDEEPIKIIKNAGGTNEGELSLNLPQWGYDDFINERNIWLKQITNKLNGPSLFYFKIFFEFNTNYGLFGGLLNNAEYFGTNSAYKYLLTWEEYYGEKYVKDRYTALQKFTQLLSYISMYSPWFFKSIRNLQSASSVYVKEFGKEKSIDLELEEEAIDMRISTLFSLYKHACFDDVYCREIIPENLRKFNMIVVLFESPIKYIHTPIAHDSYIDKKNYKSLFNPISENGNTMSFKTFAFKNCEFSMDSINSYIKADISNESGFNLGKNNIKITYDRVYEYVSNEYMGLLVGSDGIYYYNEDDILPTYDLYNKAHDQMVANDHVVTASEYMIRDNIQQILGSNSNYALGNIFGADVKLYKSYPNMTIDKSNPTIAKNNFTEYTKAKFGMYAKQKFSLTNLGFNMLYKWLGSDYHAGSVQGINDVGTVLSGSTVEGGLRLGSASYTDKLKRIKYGSNGSISYRNARMNIEAAAQNMKHSLGRQITKNALGIVKPLKI